jgi:hypothetical protein
VSLSSDVWTPDANVIADAQQEWSACLAANPALFDGQLIQVAGVHRNGHGGAVIQGMPCSYRWYAAQASGGDFGCRPLGVKVMMRRGDQVLFGKRAKWTSHAAGQWELAQTVRAELREEVGVDVSGPPIARAVMFDPEAKSWEVVFVLEAKQGSFSPETGEYEQLIWADPSTPPGELTAIAQRMLKYLC